MRNQSWWLRSSAVAIFLRSSLAYPRPEERDHRPSRRIFFLAHAPSLHFPQQPARIRLTALRRGGARLRRTPVPSIAPSPGRGASPALLIIAPSSAPSSPPTAPQPPLLLPRRSSSAPTLCISTSFLARGRDRAHSLGRTCRQQRTCVIDSLWEKGRYGELERNVVEKAVGSEKCGQGPPLSRRPFCAASIASSPPRSRRRLRARGRGAPARGSPRHA